MGAHAQHHNDLPSTTAALHRRIGEASASMCTSCSGSSFCSTQVATHRPPHPPVTTTSHPLMPERIRYSWPTLWNALEFLNVNSDSELHYEICRSQTSNTNEGWVLNHRCQAVCAATKYLPQCTSKYCTDQSGQRIASALKAFVFHSYCSLPWFPFS